MQKIRLTVFLFLAGCQTVGSSDYPAPARPLSADFQRGVNHAHIHRRGHGYGSAVSLAELKRLREIGVNWIALTPFGYQNSARATEIVGFPGREGASEFFARTDPTMTDDDIIQEIKNAHSLGVKVVLKPQIWSRDFWDGQEWHGSVDQPSASGHRSWWASYRNYILHYARVGERAGVDLFCVGTELVQMTRRYPEEWRVLIRELREILPPSTPISYAAHWDQEYKEISFWDELDYIGIGAYFPLKAPDQPTVEQLVRAWKPYRDAMEKLSQRWERPVVFFEAGYRAVRGHHKTPWTYSGGKKDPQAQALAYEALFRALSSRPWWKGVYFWKTFTDQALASVRGDGTGYSFRGQPAEENLKRWFNKK